MKSTSFIGEDQIVVTEADSPRPGPGEVRLKVSYCALCGSDKRLFHNGAKVTPGHELSGTVIECGEGVELASDTRGVVYIANYCGKCRFCKAGETNRCLNISGLVGWQTPGGYAEELVVRAANFVPLPDDIADDEGVLLLDTIGTANYGIGMVAHRPQSAASSGRALVLGCGPLGLGSLLTLQALGWKAVSAYDPAGWRLAQAESFGGVPIDIQDAELESSFSLVVEASGHHSSRNTALDVVEPGGAVLLLGENDQPWTVVETPKLRRKDCFYVRSFYFPIGDLGKNAEILRARRGDFKRMISAVVPLKGLQGAFEQFCAGKTIKPLVRPNQ
ncbi:MAG TPA: alcohol dehydrogenase catalytic domain-containing protein [Chloroflexota bacterium]